MSSLLYKFRLLRGLLSGERARTGPLIVLVDTTYRCNLRCPGCRYHSPLLEPYSQEDRSRKDFPLPLFERVCDQLQAMGTAQIILTGEGEPLLHPELVRLVSAAGKRGLHTTLFTNGTLLEEPGIRGLVGSGLDVMTVSLWAGSEEDYRRNYPDTDPGMFRTVVGNLRRLSRAKTEMRRNLPSIRLYQPINRTNFENIPRMADLACETGCNELFFSPLRTRRGKLESLALTPSEVESVSRSLRQVKDRLYALGIRHNIHQVLLRYRLGESAGQRIPCYVGWLQAHIQPDGSAFACKSCKLPMGNLNDSSFAEIWNGPSFRRFRRDMLSLSGREGLEPQLDCGFCGQLPDNLRVHRVFRWFTPFR